VDEGVYKNIGKAVVLLILLALVRQVLLSDDESPGDAAG
jgi:hypothetical protein